MSAVLADTHAVLWYLASPEKLSSAATAALDDALAANARIYVASISVVEVAYLVEKGRLPVDEDLPRALADQLEEHDVFEPHGTPTELNTVEALLLPGESETVNHLTCPA